MEFFRSKANLVADHTSRLDRIYLDELEMLTEKYNSKKFQKQPELIQRVEQSFTITVKPNQPDNTLEDWIKIN